MKRFRGIVTIREAGPAVQMGLVLEFVQKFKKHNQVYQQETYNVIRGGLGKLKQK